MYQVQHVCHKAGIEPDIPGHGNVCQGSGDAPEATAGGRGVAENIGII